ncbi:hypothetical protein CBR_g51505 [Chara braunii]|uniref:GIY-YIG domain-containing protein n=1 Tax=Chara braunii TaxID=69332 RepID=A0A388K6E8_CHABU|nr:hypothetical protein CBR_g51505 [Chara braunii]|eukprot:GBG65622.1 hypothetical protein CBR_g51505 [Chara braunii]
MMKQEESFRMEEEQDARLLRVIRGEMRKDSEDNYSRSNTRRKGTKMKSMEPSESASEEKERLRKFLALCGKFNIDDDDTSDEELKLLLQRTAKPLLKSVINEKRKRGPEVNIGNSPPMVTPEKKASTRPLEETKTTIDELRNTKIGLKDLGTPRMIDLSLKHISASLGVGGREKFERECCDFYDALTIDELKVYIGMTERDLWARWREHFCHGKTGGCKRRRKLYNWLNKVGAHKYEAVPIFVSESKSELLAVERTLIKRWSPSLNSRPANNKKGEKKKRRRRGKRERGKENGGKTPGNGGFRKFGGRIVAIGEASTDGETGDRGETVNMVESLRKVVREKEKKDIVIQSDGGDIGADGWRVVRRLFGETRVKVGQAVRGRESVSSTGCRISSRTPRMCRGTNKDGEEVR